MARPKQPFCASSPARSFGREGFTLIELLVALGIVSILSAIVFPTYTNYISRASRAEVKGILLENAMFLERNYTLANRYDLDGNGAAVVLPYGQSPKNGAVKYNIEVLFPTIDRCAGGQCFTLFARPAGTMAHDACGTYQLTHAGAQDSIGAMGAEDCWQR